MISCLCLLRPPCCRATSGYQSADSPDEKGGLYRENGYSSYKTTRTTDPGYRGHTPAVTRRGYQAALRGVVCLPR